MLQQPQTVRLTCCTTNHQTPLAQRNGTFHSVFATPQVVPYHNRVQIRLREPEVCFRARDD